MIAKKAKSFGVVVFVSMSERKLEMFNTRVTEN